MGKLEGRVAFITGAARGQGRAHAVRLAQEGAAIVAIDICAQLPMVPYPMPTPADLEETANLVKAAGGDVQVSVADVRDLDQVQAAVAAGIERFGHIDIALANAGIILSGTTDEDDVAAFRLGIDVLLGGVWNTLRAVVPHMVERQSGVIVATSSTAGLKAFTDGRGGTDAYTCAKTAIVGLVKAYAAYLGPHNVRVNAVAPTGVNTPMITENPALFEIIMEHPHLQASMTNSLPVEMIQPSDVSDVVAFLVSDDARYLTGSTIAVDAGAMAR
jgi:SDR family mycofactocin-dependent oxidoreductase